MLQKPFHGIITLLLFVSVLSVHVMPLTAQEVSDDLQTNCTLSENSSNLSQEDSCSLVANFYSQEACCTPPMDCCSQPICCPPQDCCPTVESCCPPQSCCYPTQSSCCFGQPCCPPTPRCCFGSQSYGGMLGGALLGAAAGAGTGYAVSHDRKRSHSCKKHKGDKCNHKDRLDGTLIFTSVVVDIQLFEGGSYVCFVSGPDGKVVETEPQPLNNVPIDFILCNLAIEKPLFGTYTFGIQIRDEGDLNIGLSLINSVQTVFNNSVTNNLIIDLEAIVIPPGPVFNQGQMSTQFVLGPEFVGR